MVYKEKLNSNLILYRVQARHSAGMTFHLYNFIVILNLRKNNFKSTLRRILENPVE